MSVGKLSARSLAMSGLIAALYAALSLVSTAVGLGFDAVQLRLSEALCLLPFLFPEAVPGLAIGCLFADIDAICLQVFTDTLQDAPDLCVGIAMFQPEDGELAQGLDALEQMAHLLSQIRAIC